MKRTMLISMAALALASIVAVEAHTIFSKSATANDDQSAGGWEYLVVQGGTVNLSGDGGSMRKEPGAFSREAYPLERNMDKLGTKGWELVTVAGSPADPIFYFKRRK